MKNLTCPIFSKNAKNTFDQVLSVFVIQVSHMFDQIFYCILVNPIGSTNTKPQSRSKVNIVQ